MGRPFKLLALAVGLAAALPPAGTPSRAAGPAAGAAPIAGAAPTAGAADAKAPRATLSARAYFDRTAAGLPVLLELSVTNAGTVPFYYMYGGPGHYPSARPFTAVVVGPDGRSSDVPLTNGQYEGGLFSQGVTVYPGTVERLPAALALPGPGTYTIRQIRGEALGGRQGPDEAMTVTWPAMSFDADLVVRVVDDPAGSARFAADWLARVRANEGFARHVAAEYHVPGVAEAMVADLASDDPEVVTRAAEMLSMLDDPRPAGLGDALRRATARWLRDESPDFNALAYLATTATSDGSDASLDAVLAMVADERVRRHGGNLVLELAQFKQPRADAAVRRLLADPDPGTRFAAASCLSRRLDPAAVPVFVAAARDPADPGRRHAFAALADYVDDPRAAAAIELGLADADASVREAAAAAKASLERGRKWRAEAAAEAAAAATRPATAPAPPAGVGPHR